MQISSIPPTLAARKAKVAELQKQHEAAEQKLAHVAAAAETVLQVHGRGVTPHNLTNAASNLIALLQQLLLLPREAVPKSVVSSDMVTKVDAAMTTVYTIDSEPLIQSVINLWDSAAQAWLLPPSYPQATGAKVSQLHSTSALISLLRSHQQGAAMLPAVITWIHTFVRITGVNPVAHSHSCAPILATLTFLVLSNIDSQSSSSSPSAAAEPPARQLPERAIACLYETMIHGPVQDLLQAEQRYSQTYEAWIQQQAGAHLGTAGQGPWCQQQQQPAQQPCKPDTPSPLFSKVNTTSPGQPGKAALDTTQLQQEQQEQQAAHVPYAMQALQLLLWVLQHDSFDDMEWDDRVHPQRVMELLVQICTGFGANMATLDTALLSILHPIAVAMAPVKAASRSKAKQPGNGVGAAAAAAGGVGHLEISIDTQRPQHADSYQLCGMEVTPIVADTATAPTSAGPVTSHAAAKIQVETVLCELLHGWMWTNPGLRVISTCAAAPSLPTLLAVLLYSVGGCMDRAAATGVLELLKLMHAGPHQLPALLNSCAELLRPETNCAVDVRLQAIAVMQTAVERHASIQAEQQTQAGGDDPSHQAGTDASEGGAHVWSAYAQDVVLFSIMHDPSTRVRRGAVQLLPSMLGQLCKGHDFSCQVAASPIMEVVISKTRDKDEVVAGHALHYLLALPPPALHTAIMLCSTAESLALLQSTLQLLNKQPQAQVACGIRGLLSGLALSVTGNATAAAPTEHHTAGHVSPVHPVAQLVMLALAASNGQAGSADAAAGARFLEQAGAACVAAT